MAKRYGTVIVLREGTTKKQADKFMERVRAMSEIELGDFYMGEESVRSPSVQEYDDKYGSGPVWYIP